MLLKLMAVVYILIPYENKVYMLHCELDRCAVKEGKTRLDIEVDRPRRKKLINKCPCHNAFDFFVQKQVPEMKQWGYKQATNKGGLPNRSPGYDKPSRYTFVHRHRRYFLFQPEISKCLLGDVGKGYYQSLL